jgi:hypothetical protein
VKRQDRVVSSSPRTFLLLEQGVGSVVVNLPLNVAIAWLSFRGASEVPFWGSQSIAADTIATCFLLPLITTLIVTPLSRSRVRSGSVRPLDWTAGMRSTLGWLPSGTWWRGVAFGALATLVIAPVALIALRVLDVDAMRFGPFVAFKGAFAAALGVLVAPMVAGYAIAADPA